MNSQQDQNCIFVERVPHIAGKTDHVQEIQCRNVAKRPWLGASEQEDKDDRAENSDIDGLALDGRRVDHRLGRRRRRVGGV